jgi:ApaG protein
MYQATTRQIKITVTPSYLAENSSPEDGQFVWAYQVQIENLGPETVQLMSRFWRITDAKGEVHEVRGAGVVGEQPVLSPGKSFSYASGTPLQTPSGIMAGHYFMHNERGEAFKVEIPAFSLDSPLSLAQVN